MGDGKGISEEITTSKIAIRKEALLSVSDAQAVLTRVEDSLETVLDVLREMKSHVANVPTRREMSIVVRMNAFARRFSARISRSDGEKLSPDRFDHLRRLESLSQEIDQILRDTKFAGTPLLVRSQAAPTFVVDTAQGDLIEISFDPLSAAVLTVTPGDVRSSFSQGYQSTLDLIDEADVQVREHLSKLVGYRNRLGFTRQQMELRCIRGRQRGEIPDVASARAYLAATIRRIIDNADEATLAQAHELSHAAKRLAGSMFGSDDDEAARVYVLDDDGESAPVAHLRRTMIRSTS